MKCIRCEKKTNLVTDGLCPSCREKDIKKGTISNKTVKCRDSMQKRIIAHSFKAGDEFNLTWENVVHTETIIVEGEHGTRVPMLKVWVVEKV
jgi:hypothetical protein